MTSAIVARASVVCRPLVVVGAAAWGRGEVDEVASVDG
jgi:hypothetical protein